MTALGGTEALRSSDAGPEFSHRRQWCDFPSLRCFFAGIVKKVQDVTAHSKKRQNPMKLSHRPSVMWKQYAPPRDARQRTTPRQGDVFAADSRVARDELIQPRLHSIRFTEYSSPPRR